MVNGSTSISGIDTQMENSRHRYLYTAPERDIFSSAHDELALSKERIYFSDLAAETQDIICAENPAFERSTFDSWDFFIWGNLSDLEMLLQKPVENENDGYISKDLLKGLLVRIQDQIQIYLSRSPKSLIFQGKSLFQRSVFDCFPLFLPLSGKTRESFSFLLADHFVQQSCRGAFCFLCRVCVDIHRGTHIRMS